LRVTLSCSIVGQGAKALVINVGDVRFGAHTGLKSDIVPCPFCAAKNGSVASFYHLVGASEEARRNFETKRLRGF
jgi:hypothetical protein